MRTIYPVKTEIDPANLPEIGSIPTWNGNEFVLEKTSVLDDLWGFTTSGTPSVSEIKTNESGFLTSSTTLLIAEESLSNVNYEPIYSIISKGTLITISQTDVGSSISYIIDDVGVDSGVYWEFPLDYFIGSGFTPSGGDDIRVSVGGISGASGTSGSNGTSGTSGTNGTSGTTPTITIFRESSSFTLTTPTYIDSYIICNNSTPITITIPDVVDENFPVGTKIQVFREGSGQVEFGVGSPSSVTVYTKGSDISPQYGHATLIKVDNDEWNIFGDLI